MASDVEFDPVPPMTLQRPAAAFTPTNTYYAKQLAQHAVMEMTEVPILANEIEVS